MATKFTNTIKLVNQKVLKVHASRQHPIRYSGKALDSTRRPFVGVWNQPKGFGANRFIRERYQFSDGITSSKDTERWQPKGDAKSVQVFVPNTKDQVYIPEAVKNEEKSKETDLKDTSKEESELEQELMKKLVNTRSIEAKFKQRLSIMNMRKAEGFNDLDDEED